MILLEKNQKHLSFVLEVPQLLPFRSGKEPMLSVFGHAIPLTKPTKMRRCLRLQDALETSGNIEI